MRFRDFHRNIKIRIAESFISTLVGNMVFPFMAIYFAQHFGASITGILLIVNVFIGMISGFYGGYLADKIGRRRIMIISECIRLVSFIIMTLANSPWLDSAMITFAMMVINSVCYGLSGPAAQAMIIDVSDSDNRKFIYSIDYWSMNAAIVAGGFIGGFLFKDYRFELFMMITLGSLISLLLLVIFIKETYQPEIKEESIHKKGVLRDIIANYRTVLKDSTFLIYTLASLLVLSVEFQARNYIGVRLAKEMGEQTLFSVGNFSMTVDGVKFFGILNAENGLLVVLLGIFISRITKRFSDKWVLYTGILLNAVSYLIIGASSIPWVLLFFMVIATLGEVTWWPIKQAYLADIAPAENRSSYMAVSGLVGRGAMMIGSLAITLGAFLPASAMGIIFLLTGLVGLLLFRMIMSRLDDRKIVSSKPQVTLSN